MTDTTLSRRPHPQGGPSTPGPASKDAGPGGYLTGGFDRSAPKTEGIPAEKAGLAQEAGLAKDAGLAQEAGLEKYTPLAEKISLAETGQAGPRTAEPDRARSVVFFAAVFTLLLAAAACAASGPGGTAQVLQARDGTDLAIRTSGPAVSADALDAMEQSLEDVKTAFEREASETRDPRALRAVSWKASGLAFMEALAVMEPARFGDFRDRNTEAMELLWSDMKADWGQRELKAMRLCDDVWTRMAAVLAIRAGSNSILEDLEGVMTRHEAVSDSARTEPARLAEARVFWSNRLAVLFPLQARAIAPALTSALDDITQDLVNSAEVVAERRDIHHQARMDLLYNNNARSIASMMFLVLTQESSPYLGDARALRQSWDDSMTNPSFKVSDKLSHSLMTAAQLSFPLAHWIASAGR
jgi:hypothetical protein